ncbi:glycosyltransferase [Saccharothrix coeruleofusca]|uniref:Glycosyl transferase n=1 Tax=Saccharothrix coeruleofusca TaxID=33919 RepID=A0A918ECN4_9PSEU|nr:glycosyltransferase [Saccharothrix coeruleofusca]MBP2340122.1 glycosyltransferase involved in cell wall biosynthesis [Saccharothrix coeruleofusca]GGP37166.1 glycosyl transferase [Saccharothrix coeruleofusca]
MDKLPEIVELLDESGIGLADGEGLLDERERRILIGAVNFHALARPGRTFRITVLRGPRGTMPSLTDDRTRHIEWGDDREVVGSLVVRSTVQTTSGTNPPEGLVDLAVDLGGEPEVASAYHQLPGLMGKVRRSVRFFAPVQFDVLRQYRTDVTEKRYRKREVPKKAPVRITRGTTATGHGATPAIIFGIHWLELGGAERFALETVQLAKEAGFTPIVITDRPSTHPWITRPELDGAIVVPLTHPVSPEQESAFLNGVLSAYDVRGVHLHHSTWLAQRLPWLKSIRPDLPVIDSLHILEWRTGGFVDISVRMTNVIDHHHVISPMLRDYLVGKQGVDPAKVELATLANLTTKGIGQAAAKAKSDDGPFTVAFVGRFTQQKRPYLFLQLAASLKGSASREIRFIVHGDGELAGEVHGLVSRLGLSDVLELRGSDKPVAKTLADADVLVISSDNEGLTLTSFEATAAGVPVVSTDVGSQASLVAEDLLVPRHPYPFISTAAERIRTMINSPEQRKTWLDEQAGKAAAFAKLPDARTWVRDTYEGWLK